MKPDSSLSLHYAFDIDEDNYIDLARLQVSAIRQRGGQDCTVSYDTDVELTKENIADFFNSTYEDYEVVVVYGTTPKQTQVPLAYGVAAPHETDEKCYIIDQLYALRDIKIDGDYYNLKHLDLGKNVLNHLVENVEDVSDKLMAKPLEGSERFYHANGFRKEDNSIFLVKPLQKPEYA